MTRNQRAAATSAVNARARETLTTIPDHDARNRALIKVSIDAVDAVNGRGRVDGLPLTPQTIWDWLPPIFAACRETDPSDASIQLRSDAIPWWAESTPEPTLVDLARERLGRAGPDRLVSVTTALIAETVDRRHFAALQAVVEVLADPVENDVHE